jgi:hypothetical protein
MPFILALLVLSCLALSFAVPAEDLPETPYNESILQPCDALCTVSNFIPNAVPSLTNAEWSVPCFQLPVIFCVNPGRTGAHPFRGARVTLALMSSLLC